VVFDDRELLVTEFACDELVAQFAKLRGRSYSPFLVAHMPPT
jgi:hypothetical protein